MVFLLKILCRGFVIGKCLSIKSKNSSPSLVLRRAQKGGVNKCLEDNLIYKATVKDNETEAEYIGCTTTTFKDRFANHKKSIKHERYQHDTALSTYIWTNNLQNDPKITWKIVKKCHLYQPGQKTCQMCLLEKYYIIQGMKKNNSLNKKTDIGNKCVHVRDATFAYAIT